MAAPPNQTGGGSVSDILTTLKNLVAALNFAAQSYNNVNGVSTKEAISVATVVKTSPGRACSLSVITAGSTTGMIYDAANLNNTTAPLWVIPAAAASNGQPYIVNMPTDSGIVVVPGTGQVVTMCWS